MIPSWTWVFLLVGNLFFMFIHLFNFLTESNSFDSFGYLILVVIGFFGAHIALKNLTGEGFIR